MVFLKEKTLLKEFRGTLEEKFADDFEDYILLAYLRACKMDLSRAVQMFSKAVEVEYNLSGLNRRVDFPNHQSVKEISNDITYKYLGSDNVGRPVFWIPAGRYNASRHIENGLVKELWLHVFKCIHEGFHKLYELGEKTGVHQNVVLIIDLKGLTISKVANYELIQGSLNILRDFQSMANLIDRVYIVNGNWVTNYLMKLALPFMERKTSRKIERLHTTDILCQIMSVDILPREYCGARIKNNAVEVEYNLSGLNRRVDFPNHQSVKEISNDITYKYLGSDNVGRPVFWIPAGRYNASRHIENGLVKELWLHVFKCIHEGFHKLYELGEKTGVHQNVVLIIDLKDLTISKVANYELIQGSRNILRDFQSMANLIDRVYIVNGNWVTNYLMKLALPFLERKTSRKIERLYTTVILRQIMPVDILPREYCRTRTKSNT